MVYSIHEKKRHLLLKESPFLPSHQSIGLTPHVRLVSFFASSRCASSVPAHHSTRSLSFVRRGYFFMPSAFQCCSAPLHLGIWKGKKPPLVFSVVAPSPFGTLVGTPSADFIIFSRYFAIRWQGIATYYGYVTVTSLMPRTSAFVPVSVPLYDCHSPRPSAFVKKKTFS